MFALVDKSDNSITKMLNGNKGITIGDNQYPRAIYTLWTEAERNAINIYTVEYDDSNKKMRNGISIQINLMHLVVVKSQQHMVLQLQKHTLMLLLQQKMKKMEKVQKVN